MKKILYIVPYRKDIVAGGALKVAQMQIDILIQNGYDVTVVTTDAFQNNIKYGQSREAKKGLHIYTFANISKYLAEKLNFYTCKGLGAWLDQNIKMFDIVYIHDFLVYPNYIVAKKCKKNNIKYFIQPHGGAIIGEGRGMIYIKKLFLWWFGKYLLENAYKVIVVSDYEKKLLPCNINDNNIYTLYNGLEKKKIDMFLNSINYQDKINILDRFGLTKNDKIIISVCRIQHIKRLDKTIEYFKRIIEKDNSIKLVIIGPDEGEKENIINLSIKLGIDKNIIFTGPLFDKDLRTFYKIAKLFILTSDSEGAPVSVIEARYCNVPIILSKGADTTPERFEKIGIYRIEDMEDFELKFLNLINCTYLHKEELDYNNIFEKFLTKFLH